VVSKAVEAVTPAGVLRAAKQYLEKVTTVVLRPRWSLLASLRARFLGGLDLVGEHRGGQGAGRLVFVDVLTVGLIALHEVALRSPKSAGPT